MTDQPAPAKRAVIYSRVSDWTQAGAGAARAAQLAWCEAKAAEIGAGVVGRFDDHDGAGWEGLSQAVESCKALGAVLVIYNSQAIAEATDLVAGIEVLVCQAC